MRSAVLGCALLAVGAGSAAATTVNVNTTNNQSVSGDGYCSLSEAIAYGNGSAEPDCVTTPRSGLATIELPAGQYTMPTGTKLYGMTIIGAGAASTDIDGGGVSTVLGIQSGSTVTLSGVTISGGMSAITKCMGPSLGNPCPAEDGDQAGGIDNQGNLTLNDVTVSGNKTAAGTTGSYVTTGFDCGLTTCTAIAGPDGGGGGDGAGIYNEAGADLTVVDSSITGNQTGAGSAGGTGRSGTGSDAGNGESGGSGGNGGNGAGIYNAAQATLTITDSSVTNNITGAGAAGADATHPMAANGNGGSGGHAGTGGDGVGIFNDGTLKATGLTIADNTSGVGGAAGSGSTPNGTGSGGYTPNGGDGGSGVGLEAFGTSSSSLLNTTIAGNAAGADARGFSFADPSLGGAIYDDSSEPTTLTDVTIAENSADIAAAIFSVGPVTETNSIIASNSLVVGGDSCMARLSDGGQNIAFASDGCPGATGDPKLGKLQSNGGPTQTMALGSGSSAISIVPTQLCGATADQRGVTRPQGAACDAGAYEVAPPGFGGLAATATGTASATVSGTATPNLTDARVTVDYGTGTSYGSTTSVVDLGPGSSAAAFSIPLTGLRAGTTYHAKVVATNSDGTTNGNDLTFTTAAAPVILPIPIIISPTVSASIASISDTTIKADTVSVKLVCGAGGPRCTGRMKLTSHVTTDGTRLVAVAASAKRRTKIEAVGGGSYSMAAGQTKTFQFKLNAAGLRLLKARHRLPATAALSGAVTLTQKVTFVYVKPKLKKRT